jgi:hypothetical protein
MLKAPTPGPGGPSITPPSVHGFSLDSKIIWTAVAALIVTVVVVKAWNALPKWLLVLVVLGVMAAVGWIGIHVAGTSVDQSGVHR